MEIRQLEYFVAVSEEANFTRAAEKLRVAQPGVSSQIRHLERELGQPLLDRSGRTVRVTEAGAAVLPYARAALAAVSGARHAVDELSGLVRGHLALGAVASPSAVDLPRLLADFRLRHTGVDITMTEANSDELLTELRGGRLDAAFVGHSVVPPSGIDTHVVADQAVVVATSRDDPLADRTSTTLAGIADRELISLPVGTGQRHSIDQAYRAAGVRPRVAFEASNPNVLARLAGFGLGVALLPESTAEAHREDLHILTLTDPPLRVRFALAWKTDAPISPATRALITSVRRQFPSGPSGCRW